ncbi:unnamed protein product [Linum trigynum]|uniref:Uncharacterized protein n=1 Tax=Linum trigynum TaxID=586398 RepID=A0AAV2D2E2_9ROSI
MATATATATEELPLETLSLEENQQRRPRKDSDSRKMEVQAWMRDERESLHLDEYMFTDRNELDGEAKKLRQLRNEVLKMLSEETEDMDSESRKS